MIKLIELYRWLKGFIVIEIKGGFPERFLNLCNKEGLYLWDTVYINDSLIASVSCKDFKKLKKIRAKSGVKIKIKNKNGLIFNLKRIKKRKALIYGMITSLILMILMNQFVWCINVQGAEKISDNEILRSLQQLGLDFGTFVPFFDETEAGREAVNQFDGKILWTSINIKGSKANIEVREYTSDKAENNYSQAPCNVIADFDGVIVSAETFYGVLSVSSGSAVKKGDLLISGISENADGTVNFHSADGKLAALHKSKLNFTYNKNQNIEVLNENHSFKKVKIFSFDIAPERLFDFNEALKYEKRLEINGVLLPFSYVKLCDTEKTACKNLESDIVFAVDGFTKKEYAQFKNTLLIDSDYNFSIAEDGYNIKSSYNCIDFIGKKNVILQEN